MDYVSWLFIHPGIHGAATVEIEWSLQGAGVHQFDPGPLWSAGVLEEDTKPSPNCMYVCTIDVWGWCWCLFIDTLKRHMRGHLSDACQHQRKLHYLMNRLDRNRKSPRRPLAASDRIAPTFLTWKWRMLFKFLFSGGIVATWQQELKIVFVVGALINSIPPAPLVLLWCNELACHKRRRETWKHSFRDRGDQKGSEWLWLMTGAALHHMKRLSGLLRCDRREEHTRTSGLARLN